MEKDRRTLKARCGSQGSRERIPRPRHKSLTTVIAAGVEEYDRAIHLPRLIPVGPERLCDGSPENRRAILARLARALRAERNRGRAGHWTYDLNRHIGLMQAYLAERRRLDPTAGDKDKMPPPDGGD